MTSDTTSHEDSVTTSHPSRRTIVRGAAVAWAVPTISLASAAPAFAACSAIMTLTTTANYPNYTNAGTVDPTKLDISANLTNTGLTLAATSVVYNVRIPKAQYSVAPIVTAAPTAVGGVTGGTVGTAFTDDGTNWRLALSLTSNIPVNTTRAITGLQIGFRDGAGQNNAVRDNFTFANGVPFSRWGGNAFAMPNTVTVANGGCGAVGDLGGSVAATPNCDFAIGGGTNRIFWTTTTSPDGVSFDANELWNNGRSSIGRVGARIEIDKQTASRFSGGFQAAPVPWADNASGATKWTFLATNANGTANPTGGGNRFFWTFESKLSGWAPPYNSGGPRTGTSGTNNLDGPDDDWAFSWSITPVNGSGLTGFNGVRQLVLSAPHANTTAMNGSGNFVTPS